VGGRAVPDFQGLGSISALTNASILRLERVPEHFVIIVDSHVGPEFAQMHRRFGARVTVVEKGPRLLWPRGRGRPGDPQIRGHLVRTGAECIGFAPRGQGVAVEVDCESGDRELVGSQVMLAVGRRPNTDDLDLNRGGIATDAMGYIEVDDGLATSVPGVWTLGECNGHGAFTHTAYNDFEIVAANLLDGESRKVSDRVRAYALYIDPPLGRVGITLAQARAIGRALLVGRRPMDRVARAVEKGETKGFMQCVVDADSGMILGAYILGTGGDEAIHGLQDAKNTHTPYHALAKAVPIHPTVSELIPTMLGELAPDSREP
jgi:pyruvate/2-oxoglutarate dehydrogenase complex dihydrolipoamide dehydrogenase (E3) component